MAEFQEVCRQALRMGEALMAKRGVKLKYIEMNISKDGKVAIKDGGTASTAEEIEEYVMQWAAEHPEPRYPTWEEWQKANFPNANVKVSPCAFSDSKSFRCMNHGCDACRDFPIPADIAEKLGVKPIGGANDA